MHNTDPNCVWAASSFFSFFFWEKKMDWVKGADMKKNEKVLPAGPFDNLDCLCKGLQTL
jgi:hypothetical protein